MINRSSFYKLGLSVVLFSFGSVQSAVNGLQGCLPTVATEFNSLERELMKTRNRRLKEMEGILHGHVELLLEWRTLGNCIVTCATRGNVARILFENRSTEGLDGWRHGTNYVMSAKQREMVNDLISDFRQYRFYRESTTRRGVVVTVFHSERKESKTFYLPVELGDEKARRIMVEGDELSAGVYRKYRDVFDSLRPVVTRLAVEIDRNPAGRWRAEEQWKEDNNRR